MTSGAGEDDGSRAGNESKPYSFGYDITDEFGNRLFHNEQSDNRNARTGTYGYRNINGLFRTVSYVADADGYRATIDTNEPGTASGASADAVFNANPVAAPPTAPRPGGYTRPVNNGPAYIRPAAPFNVRGPGRYTGSYAGGYGGGLRGPYGGVSGGGYRGGFGGVYSGGYGSRYSGSYGSGYGGRPMGGYAGGNGIVYPGRYRAVFGRDNSGAYRGAATPNFGYGGAGYKAGNGGAGYGVTYIGTGNEAGYRAGYTGGHRRGHFGAGHSGGYASSSAFLARQHGLHSHHGFLGHHGYRGGYKAASS
nr:peroxisomal membrane protein PEX13-like [Dermacentor andersoni]